MSSLLALAPCLFVLCVVLSLNGRSLGAFIAAYLSLLALQLLILIVRDGGLYLQDIRVPFILAYSLYGLVLPLAVVAGLGDIHHLAADSHGLIHALALYALGLCGFLLVQVLWPVRCFPLELSSSAPPRACPLARLFLAASVGALFLYTSRSGVSLWPPSVDHSRLGLVYSQLWVVLNFLCAGVIAYFVLHVQSLTPMTRVWMLVCVGAYALLMVFLGNRRELTFIMLLGAAVYAASKGTAMSPRLLLVLGCAFAVFLALGVVREASDLPPAYVLSNNEFAYPMRTLVYYLGSGGWSPRLGETYAYWPLIFIPRELWSGKPISLANEFRLAAFGTMDWQGYAYTPVTEAFLNFGWLGPFVVLMATAAALNALVTVSRRALGFYFIALAFSLDINRGEFALTVYSQVITWLGYCVTALLARLRCRTDVGWHQQRHRGDFTIQDATPGESRLACFGNRAGD